MRKYLISGVPPNKGGAGRFLTNIIPLAKQQGFQVITPKTYPPYLSLIRQKKIVTVFKKLFNRYIGQIFFQCRALFIKNATVLLLHPQTVGFSVFLKLINSNIVYLYVLDNSFFCIRSRNNNPVTEKECLICLSSPQNSLPTCKPSPVKYHKQKNIEHLLKTKTLSHKIKFLAQNNNQKKLLEKFYGKNTWVKVVGMDTGERPETINGSKTNSFVNNDKNQYDFVFHGAPSIAKGIRFFICLADLLEDKTFFVPADKLKCENVIGHRITNKNIIFKNCNWETGLKEVVQESKYTINPSMWSAPIEGALIKSIFYNGNVITTETRFGYEQELSSNKFIFRVSDDPLEAAKQINTFFNNNSFSSQDSRNKWFNLYIKENSPSKLFKAIEI